MKKLGSLLLSLAMMLTVLPAAVVQAAGEGIVRAAFISKSVDELNGHGLQGDYHLLINDKAHKDDPDNFVIAEHKGTYMDRNIESGNMEALIRERTGQGDYVAAVWTGWIAPPVDGDYTFTTYSDNGVRLYIGDLENPTIDWWVNQWDKPQTSDKTFSLKAGEAYAFRMDWMEVDGGSHVTLYWQTKGDASPVVVPASAFYLPENFPGARITGLDTSAAQLNLDEGSAGGNLKITGSNLADATAQLTYMGGSGYVLEQYGQLEILQNTDTELTVLVPATLEAGFYEVLVTVNGVPTSTDSFAVSSSTAVSDRPEHPRPDWYRDQWMSLNGWWDFSYDRTDIGHTQNWQNGVEGDTKINVPFAWDSPLSGVNDTTYRGKAWYQRDIVLDESWDDQRVFVKFGAVDAISEVYVNGEFMGEHNGGYTPFEYDITDALKPAGERNILTVYVEDDASFGRDKYPALVGKQGHNAPCGYTHTSGIWQTVYLEGRSEAHFAYAHATPNVGDGSVQFEFKTNNLTGKAIDATVTYEFKSVLYNADGEKTYTGSTFKVNAHSFYVEEGEKIRTGNKLAIENPLLWDDETPNLYEGTITLTDDNTGKVLDQVTTYFGLREVTAEKYDDRNYEYIHVNGRPVFLSGLLDQGYWPEGVYTAPSEAALKYDISSMKERGFNMIRKHLKVEDPLQYVWADRLGMYVWQDMPHATAMNRGSDHGGATPGRDIYENALDAMLERDFNHPSVIAVMLFNETWGINHNAGASASDGRTTVQWIQDLYARTKAANPQLLVEDMSPCWWDHIQPTDINTFHMYPKGYVDSKNFVDDVHRGTYPGSTHNFILGYEQQGEPWLNSEYGGVAAYDQDWDVSWCFKYQTDIQRQYEKLNGFVYTEPFDVEYERNGILTYDRRDKIFGYDEVAYGGDMAFWHLTQPNYVGIDIDPAKQMRPGNMYTAPAVAMNWSGNTYEGAKLKWRFDMTDPYGNYVTTGISGEEAITYKAYTKEVVNIAFTLPETPGVGTITVWIEDAEGELLAKNFVNLIASVTNVLSMEKVGEDSWVLRENQATSDSFADGSGALEYTYYLPAGFTVDNLSSMRLLVEASSRKDETVNFGISNSAASQTTVGSERASDMTVTLNGHEVDTVYLPDNPRDIRGTLTLTSALNGGSSAGNFGYLVNISVPDDVLAALKDELAEGEPLVVSYSVKGDAENKNGLRIYNDNTGRYMLNPTVLLNPADVVATGAYEGELDYNYSVETTLADGESFTVRGGGYTVALKGGVLSVSGVGEAKVGSGADVRVRLFDDRITVYANNNPEPVIDGYDYSGHTGGVEAAPDKAFVVSPESYEQNPLPVMQEEVQIVDHYNTNSNSATHANRGNDTWEANYTLYKGNDGAPNGAITNGGTWDANNKTNNALNVVAQAGDKAVLKGSETSDVIVEVDITLTNVAGGSNGNLGVIVRGTDFRDGCDNANGYYAGLGYGGGSGFIEVGKMHQGWTALGKVNVPVNIGETHRLTVSAIGPRIRVYLDDESEPRVDVYDDAYLAGGVALRGFLATGTYDNLVVSTAPRYQADFTDSTLGEWGARIGEWKIADGALTGTGAGLALVGNHSWSDYEYNADVTVESGGVAGIALRSMIVKGAVSGYFVTLDESNNLLQLVKTVDGDAEVLAQHSMDIDAGTPYALKARIVNNAIRVYLGDEAGTPLVMAVDNSFTTGRAGALVSSGTAHFDNVDIKDKFVYQDEFFDGALSGWDIINGNVSVADNTLTINRRNNGDKIVDGYATWKDYTIRADVKLDIDPNVKSNAGFVFRATVLTPGQDNLRGYVLGINHHKNNSNPNEQTGIEFGDIHYGWRPIANTDEFTFDGDEWYDLQITVEGDTITATVDGREYYSVNDGAYSYGQFGIRIFNSGVNVRNLRVVPKGETMPDSTYNVSGAVTSDDEDMSLAGIAVEMYAAEDEDFEDVIAKGVTDEEGAFTTQPGAANGSYVLKVEGVQDVYDTVVVEVTIEDAPVKDVEIALAAYPAEKAILGNLLREVAGFNEASFEAEAWADFQDEIAKAQAVYEAPGSEAADYQAAIEALYDAIDELQKHYLRTYFDDLQDTINRLRALNDGGTYTSGSWSDFEDLLNEAQRMVDEGTASELEAVAKEIQLTGAQSKLVRNVKVGELRDLLATARGLDTSNTMPTPLALLQEAMDNAQSVLDAEVAASEPVTNEETALRQAEIQKAMDALFNAMEILFDQANKDLLRSLVEMVEAFDENAYTPASWAPFAAALAEGQKLLADGDAFQEDVNDAYSVLLAAMRNLKIALYTGDLEKAIARADGIMAEESAYVPSSIAGLPAELAKAKAVLADGNSTQTQIDNATTALNAEIAKARKQANKENLQKLVGAAGKLDLSLFTPASAAMVSTALAKAQDVLADVEAEQTEVNISEDALRRAMNALELKDTGIPAPGGDNNNGGDNGDNGSDGNTGGGGSTDKGGSNNAGGNQSTGSESSTALNPAPAMPGGTGRTGGGTNNEAGAARVLEPQPVEEPETEEPGGDNATRNNMVTETSRIELEGGETPTVGGANALQVNWLVMVLALLGLAAAGTIIFIVVRRKKKDQTS